MCASKSKAARSAFVQEERDLDGYEGGEASGQAQYQEEEEEVNSSGIAAAV